MTEDDLIKRERLTMHKIIGFEEELADADIDFEDLSALLFFARDYQPIVFNKETMANLVEKGLLIEFEDGGYAIPFSGIEYLRAILNVRVPNYESPDATAESIVELESRNPSDDGVQ